jgi:hypothetical protein
MQLADDSYRRYRRDRLAERNNRALELADEASFFNVYDVFHFRAVIHIQADAASACWGTQLPTTVSRFVSGREMSSQGGPRMGCTFTKRGHW